MHVLIENVRGVAHAEFELKGITLVGGENGAGKSSVYQAIAAALTRNAAPIRGMKKNESPLFLRNGAKKGSVYVTAENKAAAITWPSGKDSSDPGAPGASLIACGLSSIAELDPKVMAAELVHLLDLNPTFEQLQAALEGVEPGRLAAIWKVVEGEGWDAAHHRAKEHGAKAKGAWEHVTQENYGTAKAETWRAGGLIDELSEDVLAVECEAQRERLQQLQRAEVFSESALSSLKRQVEDGKAAADTLHDLQPKQNKQSATVGELRLELRHLPQVEEVATLPACPSCGTLLVVDGNTLHLPSKGVDAAENARRKTAIEAKRAELVKAEDALFNSDQQVTRLQSTIRQGDSAKRELDQAPAEGATVDEIEAAKAALELHQAALRAAQAQAQADGYQHTIVMMARIADALAPTGVRKAILAERLAAFNEQLAALSQVASWLDIHISDELGLFYGVCPYWLLSESEKFRVKVVLQIAMSDGPLLIDGADILGKVGRNQLMQLLHVCERPTLVCMTLSDRADLPDLKKAKYGASHWISEGVLQ